MVIISTSAVEVSIQAVSPELMSENFTMVGSVGAAAAGAAAAASPPAAGAAAAAAASSAQAPIGAAHSTSASSAATSAPVSALAADHLYLRNFKSMRMTCNSLLLKMSYGSSLTFRRCSTYRTRPDGWSCASA